MFDGLSDTDLKTFLYNIEEVTVDGVTYDEKGLFLRDSQYTPAESKGSGYDSLKLAANGFKTNGDTKIVIKGTLNGKEITIEYTFTA